MDTNDIKQIGIRDFLARSGITPTRENESGGMYLSPLREECTLSFHVDYHKNLWHDFGTGKGGSIIDLVMEQRNCSFREAAAYLEKDPQFPFPAR